LSATRIDGSVEPGWERVADAFRGNFGVHDELGAACAVYADGKPVVDLWGGIADERSARPWEEDAVVLVFSTTKGAVALCANLLVERGELDMDARVVDYWPEYGANGKEATLVRWMLSHEAGVPAVDVSLTLDDLCAWRPVIEALEAQTPFWEPGTEHAYHALTYGFLVGELVRRVAGKTIGAFFRNEIAEPFGLDSWIGLPEEVEPRVAHLVSPSPPPDPAAALASVLEQVGVESSAAQTAATAFQTTMTDPDSTAVRAVTLGRAFPELVTEEGGHNARAVRAAECPGSNMVTDARSLARVYAATVGEVDGRRLLQPETVEAMCVVQRPYPLPFGWPEEARPLAEHFSPFGLGFMRPSSLVPLLGPSSFGHGGAGGSLAFADVDSGIGFGYVMNRMWPTFGDPRSAGLVDAVRESL
jgi:CubicO group peptidase (beta-lactamase class C family)